MSQAGTGAASGAMAGAAFGPWGAVIGGGLGLAGGLLAASGADKQAKAQAAAAQASLDKQNIEGLKGQARLYQNLYGNKAREKLKAVLTAEDYRALFGSPGTPAQTLNPAGANGDASAIDAQLKALTDKYGGNLLISNGKIVGQSGVSRVDYQKAQNLLGQKALVGQANGQQIDVPEIGPTPGAFNNEQFDSAGPGWMDRMQSLIDTYVSEGQGLSDNFSKGMTGVDQAFAREMGRIGGMQDLNVKSAQGYGNARKAEIDRDTQRLLEQSNRASSAASRTSGVGGSVLNNQFAANARSLGEQAAGAKNQISDEQTKLLAGLRDTGIGRQQQLGGARIGAQQQGVFQKSAIDSTLLDRSQSLRQQPLQTEMSMLTGNLNNPWQGIDTTKYFAGVSGSGSALSSLGNSLSAAGGQIGTYGFLQNQNDDFLKKLQALQGSGGGGGSNLPYVGRNG